MNIALPEPLRACIAKCVGSRQFGSTSECACELIRRDQREQEVTRLRALVEERLASRTGRPDTTEDWAARAGTAKQAVFFAAPCPGGLSCGGLLQPP